jgi:predicted glycosyltransferase
MIRRAKAAALSLIDVVGPQRKKARSLSAWVRQAIRAVVSVPYKATGVSA